jgi:preprotein translocase subunit Sec63
MNSTVSLILRTPSVAAIQVSNPKLPPALLGIDKNATPDEVKKAYRKVRPRPNTLPNL